MFDEASSWLEHLKALGQSQGFLTYAQVNERLPLAIVDPEEIEAIVEQLKRSERVRVAWEYCKVFMTSTRSRRHSTRNGPWTRPRNSSDRLPTLGQIFITESRRFRNWKVL